MRQLEIMDYNGIQNRFCNVNVLQVLGFHLIGTFDCIPVFDSAPPAVRFSCSGWSVTLPQHCSLLGWVWIWVEQLEIGGSVCSARG